MPVRVLITIGLVLLVGLAGCSQPRVERVGPEERVDLTDRWNLTDSRNVANTMIEDMMTFPWLERFRESHPDRERPRVIIQSVRNYSHEHIPVDQFINELRRAMMRSGQVDFVASGEEREDIREERRDQEFHADQETRSEMGRELGADYALVGSISSTIDRLEGQRLTSYQVDLRLVDLETNVDVWIGQHQEQKLMERPERSF